MFAKVPTQALWLHIRTWLTSSASSLCARAAPPVHTWWSSCSCCLWRCRNSSWFPVLGSVIKGSLEQGKIGGQGVKDAHKANCVCKTAVLLICCSSSASDHSLGMGFLWLYVDMYSWSRAKWSLQLSGSDTDLILREASAVGQVIYSPEVPTHSFNSGGRWMWLSRCRYQHCWEVGERKSILCCKASGDQAGS